MSTKWTRAELAGVVATLRRLDESRAEGAVLTFKVKVSPELLEGMLGGTWTNADGSVARFDGVFVDDDGYAEPILTRVDQGAPR